MKVKKITEGYVIQTFVDGKCVHQDFTSTDIVEFQWENGTEIEHPTEFVQEFYHPFNMEQPQ